MEPYQINISAGLLLEDLYQDFFGLTKNTQSFLAIGPDPNSIFPMVIKIIPDFLPGVQIGPNISTVVSRPLINWTTAWVLS
jgi:hypothetical protein